MADFYSTLYKLNLVKDIISDFCSTGLTAVWHNSPDLKVIQKMEQRYKKSKGQHCDLSDFCLRLSDIPKVHYEFMIIIDWLDCGDETPTKGQTGFYKSVFSDKQGIAKVEYFMTIDKYIQLLLIELSLRELFQDKAFVGNYQKRTASQF